MQKTAAHIGIVEINKVKDFLDRAISTFIEVEISLGLLDWLASGFNMNLWHQIYASLGAALAATIKTLFFQYKNRSNLGSALPGVVEVKKEV